MTCGVRPSDVLEYEGSVFERILLDVEILSEPVEGVSVASSIAKKRSTAEWSKKLAEAYKQLRGD